eukprot:198646_1
MGDRHWEQPLSMIQDILIKISDFIELRNEFYAQIIKQLSRNPSRESRIKGWNLMTVVLDTLKPPKDIENYLEKWLRDNPPEKDSRDDGDDEFYVRLLHQTIFLGSRSKIPTLNQINDLFLNKNVRSLNITKQKNKEKKQEVQQQSYPQQYMQAETSAEPPALTSIHEGKMEKQRIALQWNRTIVESKQPGNEAEEVVYYCGYTMDDETRPGNNWHYAPHSQQQQQQMYSPYQVQPEPGSIGHSHPGASAIPYSVTDQARAYRLDL